jgi:hypothetical protein
MTTLAELIAAHASDLGDDYPAIAARLNAPTTIDNPVTEPPQVPHPPTLKEIYAVIPVAEAAAIYNKAGLSADIRNAIDSGDGEYLQMMLAIVLELGIISQQTATALALLLARTQPDPTWSATIAGPSLAAAAGLGTVSAAQIQQAMNA